MLIVMQLSVSINTTAIFDGTHCARTVPLNKRTSFIHYAIYRDFVLIRLKAKVQFETQRRAVQPPVTPVINLLPLGLMLVVLLAAAGCHSETDVKPSVSVTPDSDTAENERTHSNATHVSLNPEQRQAFLDEVRPQVTKFCADCHVMPRPSSSAREDWVDEVKQGFDLYEKSKRSDLEVPDYEATLQYFQLQAPEKLNFSDPGSVDPPATLATTQQQVRLPGSRPPAITNVRWIDLGVKSSPALVYCDIGTGSVVAHWPQEKDAPTRRLATLLQPVHVEPCDLDGDGAEDLVVADIGEFNANDSDLGRVMWLRHDPESHKFKPIELLSDLSRVADVRPGDFDGDGDLDLLVGVFGWRDTGQILLMSRNGVDAKGHPKFDTREIDDRHGAVNLPVIDLNGDGKLDFVALISQATETVEAFINDGSGSFKNELIYQAPDPGYGSSGIELVDLDADNDVDVLFTNGDSFDRGPKPYHSVQWLENTGDFPYIHHALGNMPGVLNAKAADFDDDGDLDIVACSLLADTNIVKFKQQDRSSLALFTQVKPGVFQRSSLETGRHQHISLETGDFNQDGKTDIAVGTFHRSGQPSEPDLVVWWNDQS